MKKVVAMLTHAFHLLITFSFSLWFRRCAVDLATENLQTQTRILDDRNGSSPKTVELRVSPIGKHCSENLEPF